MTRSISNPVRLEEQELRGSPMEEALDPPENSTRLPMWLDAAWLAFGVALLNLPGLDALEFFRHTEADRTLIAAEMVRGGEYLVPHLLGSVILTKPPLFYWLVAGAISLFGSLEEWVVRLPSALVSVCFVPLSYIAARYAGCSRPAALLNAAVLGTSMQFLTLSQVAEIDMTFGFLCACSFMLGYFAVLRLSLPLTCAAYLVAALAFLTKGPQVVAFYGATVVLFHLWQRSGRAAQERLRSDLRFLLLNIAGVAVFLLIVAAWLSAIASEVGWQPLGRELEVEVLQRVTEESPHARGPLFYPLSLLGGLAPWSPFVLLALATFRRSVREQAARIVDAHFPRPFLMYNFMLLAIAVMTLSLAAGKSSRYLFPAYAAAAVLAAAMLTRLRADDKVLSISFAALRRLLPLLAGVALVVPWFLPAERVSLGGAALTAAAFCAASLFGWDAVQRRRVGRSVVALLLFVAALRVGEKTVFADYRNSDRSVRGIAAQLDRLLPPGEKLYTIEMWERWVVYYLVRAGRTVLRLEPATAQAPGADHAYLLLSFFEENWRLTQLGFYEANVEVVADLKQGRDHLLLVRVPGSALRYLEPHDFFPTVPSDPFYFEAKLQTESTSPAGTARR